MYKCHLKQITKWKQSVKFKTIQPHQKGTDATKEEVAKEVATCEISPEARELRDKINETPEFKNKTDMAKHKNVTCKDCNAEMSLKTFRYSHTCSGPLENQAIKPKPNVEVKQNQR